MKYLIFTAAFFFTFTLAFGQSKGDKKILDSLTKAYNAPNLSKDEKWQRSLDLGVYYRDRQMFNKAQSIFQETLNGANEDGQKIETLRKIAYTYMLNNNSREASKSVIEGIKILPNIKSDSTRLYYYDRLLRNYPTDDSAYYEPYTKINKKFYTDAFISKNWLFLYRAVANLSRFYCAIGENRTAFDTLNNAIALFKKTNAFKSEIECYYQLSNAYFSKKQYKDGIKALYLYEKSIEKNRSKFKNQDIISYYSNLGESYSVLGLHRKANSLFNMSEELFDADDFKGFFYQAKGWAAYREGNREYVELFRKAEQECYRKKDYVQLVNIHPFLLVDYLLRGQKNKADSIVKTTTKYDQKENHAIFTTQFVNYFVSLGDYKKAKEIAIYGLKTNKDSNENLVLKDIYHCLYQINLKQKNYKEALYDLEQYNNLKDSMNVRETLYSLVENEMKQENEKQQYEQQQQLSKLESDKKMQRYLGGAGLLFLSILSFIFYKRYQEKIKANLEITEAHAQSEALLLNILPLEVATELKAFGKTAAQEIAAATVLFTDIQNFTQQCETMNAAEIVAELDYCFSAFDRIIAKYPIEKIKTVGDAYVCASGLPQPVETHAQDCVRAALEMQIFMLQYKIDREALGKPFFEMRIGINTGHLVAGIVGIKKFAYDIWGDTVNLAARMEQSGEVGKVNISENTYQIVNQYFICTFRGEIEAKNKGEVNMYFVEK